MRANDKVKVIVIEDDAALADSYRRMMLLLPYVAVEVIYDGARGLQRISGEPCGILFVDLHLPIVSGLEVLTAARNDPR